MLPQDGDMGAAFFFVREPPHVHISGRALVCPVPQCEFRMGSLIKHVVDLSVTPVASLDPVWLFSSDWHARKCYSHHFPEITVFPLVGME